MKQDIEKAKHLAKSMISSNFPSALQKRLLDAVDNTTFTVPSTASEFERDFTKNLQLKIESEKSDIGGFEKLSSSDIQSFLAVAAIAMKGHKQNLNIDSKPPVNSYCGSFDYQPMTDGNRTTLGSVELSFTTATGNEESRMGTLLHELGHSISDAARDPDGKVDKISGVHQCLSNQHKEKNPLKSPEVYLEEDFADSVGGESARQLSQKNSWCQFLQTTSDGSHFIDSSLQAGEKDTHSASVFRLLHLEYIKKGNLPDSCHAYLKQIGYSENFKACLDPSNSVAKPPSKAGPSVQ